jgi:hypothetical protein
MLHVMQAPYRTPAESSYGFPARHRCHGWLSVAVCGKKFCVKPFLAAAPRAQMMQVPIIALSALGARTSPVLESGARGRRHSIW